jgi:hypothetical protein
MKRKIGKNKNKVFQTQKQKAFHPIFPNSKQTSKKPLNKQSGGEEMINLVTTE